MNIFLIHFSPQDDKVLTDPTEVVNVMNDFYINIVNQIGYDSNMPSLKDYCVSDFIKRCLTTMPLISAYKIISNTFGNQNFDLKHNIIQPVETLAVLL